jgi:hypothetical protein
MLAAIVALLLVYGIVGHGGEGRVSAGADASAGKPSGLAAQATAAPGDSRARRNLDRADRRLPPSSAWQDYETPPEWPATTAVETQIDEYERLMPEPERSPEDVQFESEEAERYEEERTALDREDLAKHPPRRRPMTLGEQIADDEREVAESLANDGIVYDDPVDRFIEFFEEPVRIRRE